MTGRFEYQLKLSKARLVPLSVNEIILRNLSLEDKQILADLMLDAYRDTIDYDGETIEDALNEVVSYFSGISDSVWLESSWLAFADKKLVCACLVSFWNDRNVPSIAYVMTRAEFKGNHLATAAVLRSLQSLIDEGYEEVRVVITEGNIPSERVFAKLGFTRITSD